MEVIAFEYRKDEPFRVIKDGCIGTVRTMEGGGVSKYIMEVKVIGQMDNTLDHTFESANRVYDVGGVSPTINTCGGGGLQPKILEEPKIQILGNYQPSEHDASRVVSPNGISTAVKENHGTVTATIVAMRGRNPENPSDRTIGSPTEQRLEPNSQGLCNTLTSVQKDNLVMEERFFKQALETLESGECEVGDTIDAFNGKVNKTGISPTITTRPEGFKTAILPVVYQYRIRKLTPKECWRLMDFTDEDFKKAEEVNSNTQLYKQAGNSIVKNVLVAIIGQMIPGKEEVYKKLETR